MVFFYKRKYAMEVLKRFGMQESIPMSYPIVQGFKACRDDDGITVDETYYKQIVGNLMYLTATRPNMMFCVSLISRHMGKLLRKY